VAPLSALAVPAGFLPRAALTAAPRVAPASTAVPRAAPTSFATLTAVLDGPPPCEWLADHLRPSFAAAHPRRYHFTTPSLVISCGRSGCGGACHASGESSLDGHMGEGWFPSAT
jgi:hypothetical protein